MTISQQNEKQKESSFIAKKDILLLVVRLLSFFENPDENLQKSQYHIVAF
ncbi:hypothetical protein HB785_07530 [Listeria welshimeri]|nr:hypothetical protein [Listeria welshimeri]